MQSTGGINNIQTGRGVCSAQKKQDINVNASQDSWLVVKEACKHHRAN
jgi:hypothetical protein